MCICYMTLNWLTRTRRLLVTSPLDTRSEINLCKFGPVDLVNCVGICKLHVALIRRN